MPPDARLLKQILHHMRANGAVSLKWGDLEVQLGGQVPDRRRVGSGIRAERVVGAEDAKPVDPRVASVQRIMRELDESVA